MNEQELDTLLERLAAKHVPIPDLRNAVRMEIDRRSHAGTYSANRSAYPHMALLLPTSVLAAVLVGISVQLAAPAISPNNRQAEAAHALHLDTFTTATMPTPIINISKQEH